MATSRKPLIERHGLRFTIKPACWLDKLRPFYVVGEKPSFKLVVENPSDKRRYGKVVLRWNLLDYTTHKVIPINLKPKERKEFKIAEEWLVKAGEAVYQIVNFPNPPEHYDKISDNQLISMAMNIRYVDPLCVYVIRDKAWPC